MMKTLVVVDFQNDFLHPEGSLSCPVNDCISKEEKERRCDNIIKLIEEFHRRNFPIIFTRDWHPESSLFFTEPDPETHKPWPKHCVQNTWGAEFYRVDEYKHVLLNQNIFIINKGENGIREEYSAQHKWIPLLQYIESKYEIQEYCVVGVASEFCVKANFEDLKHLAGDDRVRVIRDAIIPAFDDIDLLNVTTDLYLCLLDK